MVVSLGATVVVSLGATVVVSLGATVVVSLGVTVVVSLGATVVVSLGATVVVSSGIVVVSEEVVSAGGEEVKSHPVADTMITRVRIMHRMDKDLFFICFLLIKISCILFYHNMCVSSTQRKDISPEYARGIYEIL